MDKVCFANKALKVSVTNNLGLYLGFPLHHERPTRASFQSVIDKVQAKLAGLKSRRLAFASRVTLVQSVNSTIPAYVMQCNFLLVSVTKALDRINRDSLWGSSVDHRKLHAVSWSNVTKPKNVGGLGSCTLCLMLI